MLLICVPGDGAYFVLQLFSRKFVHDRGPGHFVTLPSQVLILIGLGQERNSQAGEWPGKEIWGMWCPA